ncbi:MAG: phenylacetate-CoA oxygenase subunit PaaJ [Aestuariivita sp.]|nr:phenylacetate-CoA oxygenase subunit PaaJ [Aestuariivita sp.]
MTRPTVDEIWQWLDQVPDPEIPVISVVDLGIVRSVAWKDDLLEVSITPTYSGCPATSVITIDIEALLTRHGVNQFCVSQRLSPAWTTNWISEKGRACLEEYGIAPPQFVGRPKRCPHCYATELEKISDYGSTPCKAQWRCQICLEPFDYFKCH